MATKLGRVLPSGRGEFIGKEEAQGNPHEGPGTVFAPTHVVATCISAHVSLLNSGSEFTLYNACSCCCLVAQLHLTLCEPVDCSTPGFPILHHSQSLLKLMCIESVMPSHHLILCWLLLLLPSIFPSIRVFSNESALHIRWPQLQHQHQPFQ